MRLRFIAILAGIAAVAAVDPASAHHSFAMFDMEHSIELKGTVKEFKFVNPHTILVVLKGENGEVTEWMLEGGAPAMLVRAGMTAKSLKEGDEIIVTINPLHSGAPGGAYQPDRVKFKDGTPVAVPRE